MQGKDARRERGLFSGGVEFFLVVQFGRRPGGRETSQEDRCARKGIEIEPVSELTTRCADAMHNTLERRGEEERLFADPLGARSGACYGCAIEDAWWRRFHEYDCSKMTMAIAEILRATRSGLLDVLFPPLCLQCREHVGVAGNLCARCWGEIGFIDGPVCATCGLPFDMPVFEDTRCAACHAEPPDFDQARAVMRYDDASKGTILAFKHADRLDLAPVFSRWLARAGNTLLSECDVIVPVPLHRGRLWSRRYNQSAELARLLSRASGKSFLPDVLERSRRTPSQGEMPSASARRRNVEGAFQVGKERRGSLKGKNVLLIDDVLTTGATVEACARALKRAGAAKVLVLALARVVRRS